MVAKKKEVIIKILFAQVGAVSSGLVLKKDGQITNEHQFVTYTSFNDAMRGLQYPQQPFNAAICESCTDTYNEGSQKLNVKKINSLIDDGKNNDIHLKLVCYSEIQKTESEEEYKARIDSKYKEDVEAEVNRRLDEEREKHNISESEFSEKSKEEQASTIDALCAKLNGNSSIVKKGEKILKEMKVESKGMTIKEIITASDLVGELIDQK